MRFVSKNLILLICIIGAFLFAHQVYAANVNFTMAGWFNPNASIASKALVVKNNEIRLVTDASGNPACQVHNGTDWQTWATSTTALATDTWAQVVCTYDGRDIRVYVDGERTASESYTGDVANTSNVWRFGSDASAAYGDYNGRMDDLRIYKRALAPLEVRKLFQWGPPPIAHWRMDEKVKGDSKTIYNVEATSTLGLLDGTTVDGANNTGMDCTVRGKYGGACEFDGVDDYVSVTDPGAGSVLDLPGDFTVSVWVNFDHLDDAGFATRFPRIVVKGNHGNQAGDWYVGVDGIQAFASVDNAFGLSVNGQANMVWGSTSLQLNRWYHLAATKQGSTAKVFVNGVEDGSSSTFPAGDINANNNPLHIGNAPSATDSRVDGRIDDVQIFDYALNQKQIINVMNGRLPGDSSVGSPVGSQVGYWKFDEGFGSTAYDSSINDIDLTLVNTPTATTSGKFNRALAFNASSSEYGWAADSAALSVTGDLTLSAWIRPTSTAASAQFDIAGKWDGANESYLLAQYGDEIRLYIDAAANYVTSDNVNLQTGTWYQVVGVYNSTAQTVNLYVDGKRVDATVSGTIPSSIGDDAGRFHIGAEDSSSAAANFYDGVIDEVKIYNYALTPEEIALEYNQGKSVKFGALSTESDGKTPSDSASREYCPPGDTSTCRPPVGEWKFEERVKGDSKTVYDTSGNGNDGTTSDANGSGMDCTARGKIGGACEFDGVDDYVEVANNSTLDANSLTVSVWVYLRVKDASQHIVGKQDNVKNNGYDIRTSTNLTGSIEWQFDDLGAKRLSSTNISTDTWQHIVGTWDGDTMNLFINGALDKTKSGVTSYTSANNPLRMGDRYPDNDHPLNGIIDQVRIYDYARTPAQIAWEYNRGAPVGWWKFDECQGLTAYDWAPDANGGYNGNDGTITIGSGGTNTNAGTCTSGSTTQAWANGLTGKRNYSLDFDGTDDYVEVSDNAAISFAASSTSFGAWVKPGTVSGNDAILAKNNEYRIVTNGSDVACHIHDGASWQTPATSTAALTAGAWTYVLCTYDAANLKIYIDGRERASQAITNVNNDTANALRIADDASGAYTNFDGQIDDVKIFNYALTAEQVKMEYNSGAVFFGPSTGTP